MAEDKLRILIEAVDSASKTLSGVQAELARMGGTAAKTQASFTGLWQSLAAGVGAFAAFVGARKILHEIADASRRGFEEAARQEEAEVRLVAALRGLGAASAEALKQSRALASSLQSLTGVGDDVILSGQAMLVTIGRLSGEGLERATRAALGFSIVTGRDLGESFTLLARLAGGGTVALGRLGITVDETLGKTEKYAAVLKFMEDRGREAGEFMGQSFPGSLRRLDQAWGELLESMAMMISRSPAVVEALNGLIDAVERLTADMSGPAAQTQIKEYVVLLGNMASFAAFAAGAITELGHALTTGLLTNEPSELAAKLFELSGRMDSLVEKLKLAKPEMLDLPKTMATTKSAAIEASEGIGTLSPAFEKAVRTGTGFSEMLSDQAEALRQMAAAAADLTAGTSEEELGMFGGGMSIMTPEQFAENQRMIDELTAQQGAFRLQLQQTAAGAVANLGGELVSMAIMGELAFKDLGQAVRRFIAQLAAAVVQALILRAIMAAITGGSSTVAPSTSTGGGAIGPEALTTPPGGVTAEQIARLAPVSGAAVISNSFLGVSRRFVEELTAMQNDLARRHGVQILASGLVG